jgi:putative transposase
MVEVGHPTLSLRRQCAVLGLNRSSWYYQPAGESEENLALMRLIDEHYLRTPFYGWPRMTAWLQQQGHPVNSKRVRRLMQRMGLRAIYPHPNTSQPARGHRRYPYLLNGVEIVRPNQVWSADITYVPMPRGFLYLVAVIDWFSRSVVAWRLSNTLDGGFCVDALMDALQRGQPDIFNTDQGAQFTAAAFTSTVESAGIRMSMDGRGRAFDTIFVERLWRTITYEHLYLMDSTTVPELEHGLRDYLRFYNDERLHQSLGYRTPTAVYTA